MLYVTKTAQHCFPLYRLIHIECCKCLSVTDLLSCVLIFKREMCCLSEGGVSCKLSGLL